MNDEQKRLLKLAGILNETILVKEDMEVITESAAAGAVRRVKNELTTVLANALRMGLSPQDLGMVLKVAYSEAVDIGKVGQMADERDNMGAVDGVREGQSSLPPPKEMSPEEKQRAEKKKADDEWRAKRGVHGSDNRGNH